jgi:hypothetical protein
MKLRAYLRVVGCLAAGLLVTGGAQAQELGRLFFTPDQRAALDARRKARVPDKPAATPVTESPLTRIEGAVRRSSGRSTVWVNGEAIQDGTPGENPQVQPGASGAGRVSVPVGEGAQRYDLRVGETLDRGTGEVRDVIGDGEIKVRPGGAKPGPAPKK